MVKEQMERPTLKDHTDPVTGLQLTKRAAISKVIKIIEQSLSDADLRLQMLKVHVEIAMSESSESGR